MVTVNKETWAKRVERVEREMNVSNYTERLTDQQDLARRLLDNAVWLLSHSALPQIEDFGRNSALDIGLDKLENAIREAEEAADDADAV
jgi:hypothetical protein